MPRPHIHQLFHKPNKNLNDISGEHFYMVRKYGQFQVIHKFTDAMDVKNKFKVTWARTSLQIASLQNHFNFLCAAPHPDRGSELWARWPDDKARPRSDGAVNKQTGSKRCFHQVTTITAWCSWRACRLHLHDQVFKQMTRLNVGCKNAKQTSFSTETWRWYKIKTVPNNRISIK